MDAATYMYLLSTDIWFENMSHFAPDMRFCLDRLQQINADPSGNTPVNVRLPHLMPAAAREATAVCVVFVKLWQCVLCVTLRQVARGPYSRFMGSLHQRLVARLGVITARG